MVTQAVVLVRRHPGGVGPASPVCGMPLVGRLLHLLADAGIKQAFVLGELTREETEAILDEGVEMRLAVDLVHPRPGEAESSALVRISVNCGEAMLLVAGDVVASARTLAPLLEAPVVEQALVATKDGEWAGCAVLPRSLFVKFQAVQQPEKGLDLLLEKGLAVTAQVTGPVRRLLAPTMVGAVSAELLASAGKGAHDGPIARHVLRPVSRQLTRVLLRAPVTPNTVTVLWLLLGLAASFVFAFGDASAGLLGGALFFAAGLLDYVDGELARLLHQDGRGAWLDRLASDVVHAAVLAGLTARSYGETGSAVIVVAGILALWFMVMSAGAEYARLLAAVRPGRDLVPPRRARRDGRLGQALRWVRRAQGRDVLMFLVPVVAVADCAAVAVSYMLVVAAAALAVKAIEAFAPAARA
jgi:phosphatidylglycerophosphate synthase